MNRKRFYLIAAFFFVFFFAVILRLAYLQMFDAEALAKVGDKQKVRSVELTQYPRGEILDRNGAAITNNKEEPALLVFPSLIGDPEQDAAAIGKMIGVDSEDILRKIRGLKSDGTEIRRLPFVAKSKLNAEETAALQNDARAGTFIVGQIGRYQEDFPALHILGQLGKVEEADRLEKGLDSYNVGDLIGISGLEKIYEDVLRAKSGERLGLLVDERNRFIKGEGYFILEDEKEQAAGSVSLTVDLELQRVAENALNGSHGAVVVLDVENGDILALASAPGYDPYYITLPKENDAYVNKPLQTYPPASLFKILLAAAALEEGVVAMEDTFFCPGYYGMIGGKTIACWKEGGHGILTFGDALAQSCNTAFLSLGFALGGETIASYFDRWELGAEQIIGYPLEDKKNLDFNAAVDGDIANVVLGEKGVLITPVNLAKMINVIASGGMLVMPRLVTEVRSGETRKEFPASYPARIIKESTAATVKEMMTRTFQTGTAQNLQMQSLGIAGKTGTSETANVWFGGFLPAENPRYSIVVLVEGGGSGVGDAGPIFKKIAGYLHSLPIEN